jgi:hypothetical protein
VNAVITTPSRVEPTGCAAPSCRRAIKAPARAAGTNHLPRSVAATGFLDYQGPPLPCDAREPHMPRRLFQIWLGCCALLALGILGTSIVADPGADPAFTFLVYVSFCALGYILLRIIAWMLSPL